jgi:hypothetical protein
MNFSISETKVLQLSCESQDSERKFSYKGNVRSGPLKSHPCSSIINSNFLHSAKFSYLCNKINFVKNILWVGNMHCIEIAWVAYLARKGAPSE